MSFTSSCARCQRLLEAESLTGLCPVCERSTGVGLTEGTANSAPVLERTAVSPPFAEPQAPGALEAPTRLFSVDPSLAPDETDWVVRRLPPGYDPLEVLGKGGMGLVLKTWERAAERIVAVKLIRLLPDREAIERFRIEARTLASLRHPNLVQVLTVAVETGDPFFTMEYVDGGGLDGRVKEGGPLPIEEAVRVMAGAARGIAAAHAAGVVHRDLKPANVLVTADGTPKVTDFGLAKRRDRDPDLTIDGTLVGTPNYMAPEQAARQKVEVTAAADVYSLGATLYHLLTGKPPFRGASQQETLRKVLTTRPVPPRKHRPEIPADLEAVVLKCLEKDPRDRYPTAAALADDLEKIQAGLGPDHLDRWPAKAWRRTRRNWRWAAAVAAVLAVGAIGLTQLNHLSPDPERKFRDALARGETADVVPATGVPDHLKRNWLFGATALEARPGSANACSFESVNDAMLAVMRDPGRDRYAVTFELCMLRTMFLAPGDADPAAPVKNVGHPNMGVFLGYNRTAGADGSDAHTFMRVQVIDYLPDDFKKAGIVQGRVKFDVAHIHERPEKEHLTPAIGVYRPLHFPPSEGFPGKWRRVRLEVTPEAVRTFWGVGLEGEWELIAELSAHEIQEYHARVQTWFDEYAPDSKIVVAGWQPRMPVGVWSRFCGVAFRNVTVEPLP